MDGIEEGRPDIDGVFESAILDKTSFPPVLTCKQVKKFSAPPIQCCLVGFHQALFS